MTDAAAAAAAAGGLHPSSPLSDSVHSAHHHHQAPIGVDFCERFRLVSLVPAKVSSSALDRVVTHLLTQLASQASRLETVEDEGRQRRAEMAALRDAVAAREERLSRMGDQQEALLDAAAAATNRAADADAVVRQLRETVAELAAERAELRATEGERARQLQAADRRAAAAEVAVAALRRRAAADDAALPQADALARLDALEAALRAAREEAAGDGAALGAALRGELAAEAAARVAEAGAAAAGGAARAGEAEGRIGALEGRVEGVDFEGFAREVARTEERLVRLAEASRHHWAETDETIRTVSLRCDEAVLQCHSLSEQVRMKGGGGFVNESDDTAASVLSLLGSKISDILSVLVLFEAKVQKNEASLDRLEGHVAHTLQHNWSASNQARPPRDKVKKPRQPSLPSFRRPAAAAAAAEEEGAAAVVPRPPDGGGGVDGALLSTTSIFKCLSCNAALAGGRLPSAEARARLVLEAQPPGGVLRSPRRCQHGRAPLAPSLPPTATTTAGVGQLAADTAAVPAADSGAEAAAAEEAEAAAPVRVPVASSETSSVVRSVSLQSFVGSSEAAGQP